MAHTNVTLYGTHTQRERERTIGVVWNNTHSQIPKKEKKKKRNTGGARGVGVERNSGKTQHPDIWAGNLVCDLCFVFFFLVVEKFNDVVEIDEIASEKKEGWKKKKIFFYI